jgi:hypothetical protein
MPDPVTATVAAVGGSAVLGAFSSRSAAKTQAAAADRATAATLSQYEQTREDMAPWREAGGRALTQLESRLPELTRRFSLADFLKDPGYDFRLAEGEKAINRAAAARGSWDSGATGKALTRYGQDYASGEFGSAANRFRLGQEDEYNRLAGVSGTGQTTARDIGEFGARSTERASDYLMSGAAARGAGAVGAANAISGGVVGGFNAYNSYRLVDALTNRQPQTYDPYAINQGIYP